MSYSNLERVGRGLEVLRRGLSPYIARELKAAYGPKWWQVVSEHHFPVPWGWKVKKKARPLTRLMLNWMSRPCCS